jgi:hypothetical protein
MASKIPITKSAIEVDKPTSHPPYDHSVMNRIRADTVSCVRAKNAITVINGGYIPRPLSGTTEPAKLYVKVKRCLHCTFPIYCPSPNIDPNFCSKDCVVCHNWFKTPENDIPGRQPMPRAPCTTAQRDADLDGVLSFSYHPTWLKSDNL